MGEEAEEEEEEERRRVEGQPLDDDVEQGSQRPHHRPTAR
jgi:hypothetical protein